MHHPHPTRKVNQGFTLAEILLVLGIIALISIAVFILYPKVEMSQDIGESLKKYTLITSNVEDFFGGRDFDGLSASAVVSAGVLQQDDLTSPWGTIGLTPSGTGNQDFHVDFNEVPQDACIALIAALEPLSSTVQVDTTVIKSPTVAYDITAVAAACVNTTSVISAWPGEDG